jgi:hypothetical protein
MTNPKKARNPLSHEGRLNVRSAFFEETMKIAAGIAAEQGIRFLSEDTIRKFARVIPERLLHDNDSRLHWAGMLGIALGAVGIETAKRESIENFFVQAAEEVGKISNKIDVDDHEGGRKAIRGAVEAKKGGLLAALKGGKDQGDKVQKQALPDYFTAKAAIKDQDVQDTLTEIEAALPADKIEIFLNRGGYRVSTTPEELISIAKASNSKDGHAYGVRRLLGLMNGQRGEGSTGSKLRSLGENLLDDVLHSNDADSTAERFGKGVDDTRKKVQAATAKSRKFD